MSPGYHHDRHGYCPGRTGGNGISGTGVAQISTWGGSTRCSLAPWSITGRSLTSVSGAVDVIARGLGRPTLYHARAETRMQPQLKGLTILVNSQHKGWRMEDVWVDH